LRRRLFLPENEDSLSFPFRFFYSFSQLLLPPRAAPPRPSPSAPLPRIDDELPPSSLRPVCEPGAGGPPSQAPSGRRGRGFRRGFRPLPRGFRRGGAGRRRGAALGSGAGGRISGRDPSPPPPPPPGSEVAALAGADPATFSSPAVKRGSGAAGADPAAAPHLRLLIYHGSSPSPAYSTPGSCAAAASSGSELRGSARSSFSFASHCTRELTAARRCATGSVSPCSSSSSARRDHLHTGLFCRCVTGICWRQSNRS
jgi:hypothetical protein